MRYLFIGFTTGMKFDNHCFFASSVGNFHWKVAAIEGVYRELSQSSQGGVRGKTALLVILLLLLTHSRSYE